MNTKETSLAEEVKVALAANIGHVFMMNGFSLMCFKVDDVDFIFLGAQVDQQAIIGHAKGVKEVINKILSEENSFLVIVVDDIIAGCQKGNEDDCIVEGGNCFKYFAYLSFESVDNFVLEYHLNLKRR